MFDHLPAARSLHALPRRFGFRTSLLGVALAAAVPAMADPSPALDRFSLSVGAYQADPTVNASVNTRFGSLNSGNIERGHVTMPRIQADLLLGDSQGISFDYYRYKREDSGSFGSSLTAGPGVINASGSASVATKLEFGKLSYKWWLGSGDTVVGLGAGAAYYKFSADASAAATIGGLSGRASGGYSEDAVAPLLEVGVRHAITPDLRLFADASGAWKNGGNVHGNIYNAAVGVEWFPLKNVGLTLAYGVNDIDLKRGDTVEGRLRLKLQGPSAFVKARF